MKLIALILAALLLPAATTRAAAAIEGQVNLASIPKPPAPKPAARYQARGAFAAPEPPTAIIYLEGSFPAAPAPTNKTIRLEQKNYQFSPSLLAIQKGTTVEFPNRDDDYHNVFSLAKTKRFDLGHYRKDEKPAAQTFDQPGLVRLYCEIHEHMRAAILILDTPYFTRTDKDGKYRLENLPAGSYKLKAWLEEKQILEKTVELTEGQTIKVDFAK